MITLQQQGLANRPLQSLLNETPRSSGGEEEEEGRGATVAKPPSSSGEKAGNKFALLMEIDDLDL